MKQDFKNKNFLIYFKKKNIHIVGISGLEGWAMLDFFLTQGVQNITAHDFIEENKFELNFIKNHPGFSKKEIEKSLSKFSKYRKKINIFFKKNYLQDIERADFIFVPQSWFLYKENHSLLELQNKIPFWSIINLYFAFVHSKIIGITGSQGKTTTARLIHHIFKGAKRNVYYGGNDKKAVQCLSQIPKMKKSDFLILEVSHRQLRFLHKVRGPYIAVILNISKNHLDEVKNFKEYQKLKSKILLYQGKRDFAVLNLDDPIVKNFSKEARGKVIFFSKQKTLREGTFLDKKDNFLKFKTKIKEVEIIKKEILSLQAKHHIENVLAAITVSFLSKIKPRVIKKRIQTFSWPQNCLEYLGKFQGVKYYNNLASTTPQATKAAIKTLLSSQNIKNKIILITGGEDKEMDYQNLVNIIKKNLKFLILFPDSASREIKQSFSQQGKKLIKGAKNLQEAVKIIKKELNRGDVVLISPSGAFFQSKYGKRQDFLKLVSTS